MRRTIANEQGEKLDYKFHKAIPGPRRKPKKDQRPHMLIIGHGVTGNLDRPVCEALAEATALRGISVIRISFSGNGESEGKFAESNITKQLEDLGAAIDAAIESGYDVSYAGHSMGAAVGIIRASEDERLVNLIGVAPMIHTRRFVDAEFGEVTPGKGNMWGMKGHRLSTGFVEDLKSIDTVLPRVSEIDIPMLFVHGTEDDVIPWAEARAAFDFAGDPKQLISIRNANHVFEGNALQVMAHATADWLQQQVYPGSQRVKVKLPPPVKPAAPEKPPRKRAVPLSKEKRAAVQAAIKRRELEAEKQKQKEKEALKEAARKQAELLGEPYPPKRKTARKTAKKKAPAKKVAAKKAPAKKVAAKKKAAAKAPAAKKKAAPKKKVVAKKAAPKKKAAPAKKAAPKKKAVAKKAAPKKKAAKKKAASSRKK